ncbi:MAG: GerMN domain-containing protein [Spirochaetota bacterium]
MARAKRKKRASVGILFWIAFVLFIAVIFLYNRQNIENVLETTGLVDVLSDRVGLSDDEEEPEVTRTDDGEGAEPRDEDGIPQTSPDGEDPTLDLEPVPPAADDEDERDGAADERDRQPSEDEDAGAETQQQDGEESSPDSEGEASDGEEAESSGVQQRRRTASIYYIRVTDDGSIYPEEVERTVSYRDSPMTQTLKVLLQGPTREELNAGLLNLIPEDTQLLSATVEDGVAYLNFNESFRFNPMGVEGFIAQLQQIIYSTTEFSSVDEVQILIEGQRVDYLGGEGIYIGEPIGRNTFG